MGASVLCNSLVFSHHLEKISAAGQFLLLGWDRVRNQAQFQQRMINLIGHPP